jgi:hypothetical protein
MSNSEPESELVTNSAHFNYGPDTSTVLALARPSALFVNHYSSRHDPVWQEVRARGGIVLTYVNLLNVNDSPPSAVERDWYMEGNTPLWPYRDANGQPRRNWPSSKLIDIRPGSAWIPHMEDRVAALFESGVCDGIFCDSHGSRPWSSTRVVNGVTIPGADWDTWTVAEQTEWTLGCVDTARRADRLRREINERLQIVHNGNWNLSTSHPAYAAALQGEKYCDGVCIEHMKPTQLFHVAQAARAFGSLDQRRVIVIANNATEALQWAQLPGVTHVTCVDTTLGQSYKVPTPPVEGIGSEDLRLAETTSYAARLKAERDALLAAGSDDAELIALRETNAQLLATNELLSDKLELAQSARDVLAVQLQTAEASLAMGRDAARSLFQWAAL